MINWTPSYDTTELKEMIHTKGCTIDSFSRQVAELCDIKTSTIKSHVYGYGSRGIEHDERMAYSIILESDEANIDKAIKKINKEHKDKKTASYRNTIELDADKLRQAIGKRSSVSLGKELCVSKNYINASLHKKRMGREKAEQLATLLGVSLDSFVINIE